MKKLLLILLALATCAQSEAQPLNPKPLYWYEDTTRHDVWQSLNEIAIVVDPTTKPSDTTIKTSLSKMPVSISSVTGGPLYYYARVDESVSGKDLSLLRRRAQNIPEIVEVLPVFYSDSQATWGRRVLTTELVIQVSSSNSKQRIQQIAQQYPLIIVRQLPWLPNTWLLQSSDALEGLRITQQLVESNQVLLAYPVWHRTRAKRNDPLYPEQWHLKNTGQAGGTPGVDINVESVWNVHRGTHQQMVCLVDDGVEVSHEDLVANSIEEYHWNWIGNNNNPAPTNSHDYHGQGCAGVAVARGFNEIGVRGVAPYAGLVGFRLLGNESDVNEADAFTKFNQHISIYSNSWGPIDDGRLEAPGPLAEAAIESSARHGRGGLGSIFVWAGGNGHPQDNSNFDGYANSRYTIAVAASTNYGLQSYYSEEGANILVNAPSSGGSAGILTTDRTGTDGATNTSYNHSFGGTSAAAPMVAGVVALMLEANPYLSWRDVQHILMTTSTQNDPDDSDWIYNGAGYWVNHKYGYGRVNTQAAVEAAEQWVSLGNEISVEYLASPMLPIPENNAQGVSSEITVHEALTVESVYVFFDADDYTEWSNLEVTLTSPTGTESVLAPGRPNYRSYRYQNWRFSSVRHFGELSSGNWTLRVANQYADGSGTFKSWRLVVFGHLAVQPEGRVFFDRRVYRCLDQIRVTLTDSHLQGMGEYELEVTSSSGDQERISLLEQPPENSGLFQGALACQQGLPFPGDGVLQVVHNDVVTVTYYDHDAGSGIPQTVTSTSTIDCVPPASIEVLLSTPTSSQIKAEVITNKLAQVMITASTQCSGVVHSQVSSRVLNTSHTLTLSGLTHSHPYYLIVSVTDEAGNNTTDDNEGLCYRVLTPPRARSYYQQFRDNDFDLDFQKISFIPTSQSQQYAVCRTLVEEATTMNASPMVVFLGDDDYLALSLPESKKFPFFGISYSQVFLNSNGSITFDQGDTSYQESPTRHFNQPRISGLFCDLDPSQDGQIRVWFLEDRCVVGFETVPLWNSKATNTFFYHLFYDGKIDLEYHEIQTPNAIIGLSVGRGLQPDYLPENFLGESLCVVPVVVDPQIMDYNQDGVIDALDLFVFTSRWYQQQVDQ